LDVEKYFLDRKDLSEETTLVNGTVRQFQVINIKSSMRLLAAKGIVGHDFGRAVAEWQISRCKYSTIIVQQKDVVMQVNGLGDGRDGKEEKQRSRQN